ncbi:GNAT family N-acetyltransferase [Rhodovibrionaceae bacterium A322]
MTSIPTLTTQRLILRPQTLDDWPAYSALMESDRSCYMGGPFSRFQSWGVFCQDLAQWSFYGHGALMFDDRRTGQCLGQVGINHGPLFPEKELGWFVYPEAEGQGYAQEAAEALRSWAFDSLQLDSLVSYVDPDNLRSRALAERLGAQLDPDAPRQDPTDLVYRHYRTKQAVL